MITIDFALSHSFIRIVKRTLVTSQSQNYVQARFDLRSDDWTAPITAIFKADNDNNAYSILLDKNNTCIIPWEVLKNAGTVNVSAFCGDRHTANIAQFTVVQSGYTEGEMPSEPTPTVYEQILKNFEGKQDKLVAGDGIKINGNVISATDAKSAYVIALEIEITTARGGHNSLGARLDTVDSNLTKKANKSDVDSINSRLQSAETALKNKANIADVSNSLASKANKSTTLAGYGINDGENIRNKVTDKSKITDEDANYPSISYLHDYYYDCNEVDNALSGKLNNTAGTVTTDNIASKAVTTDKLADKSVAKAKLSDDLLAYIKSNSGTGNGKSAYEVAVDNGFTGTQTEWLASLKGSDYVLTDSDKTDIANIVINEYDSSLMAILGGGNGATE